MRDFLHFAKSFGRTFWLARGVLLTILLLLLICSIITFRVEDISFWDSVYLSLITGLTIGYGDITPVTFIGQLMSICEGFIGLVFIGLNVAIATLALKRTADTHRTK